MHNNTTEEKIKTTARKIFARKGYAATRTREIAEEAGVNLALINYYFRSKEKLYNGIMLESLQKLRQSMMGVVNDTELSLNEKITMLVSNYIDLFIEHPDIPFFVISEMEAHPKEFIAKMGTANSIIDSMLYRQIADAMRKNGTFRKNAPLHLIMNVASLSIFPFIMGALFHRRMDMHKTEFDALMMERKKFIPRWVKMMLECPTTIEL